MTLRVASLLDTPALAHIEQLATPHPWSEGALASTLRQPTGHALVYGEPVVAHLVYSQVLDEGEVLTLAVHPSHRRRGLARELIGALCDSWHEQGVRRGYLEVRQDNHGAIALYIATGWAITGERSDYYGPDQHALLMTLEISC